MRLLLLPLQAVREYIASYSPLHNLDPQHPHAYPALMLTASLHDTRVNFW
jgi:protease II